MKKLLNNIINSWKTSLLGVFLLIGGVYVCWLGQWEIGCGFLTSGLTALVSRDYDADHDRIEELERERYMQQTEINGLVDQLKAQHNKISQLVEIVQIIHDVNAFKNAEIYQELRNKLKQLTENE